MDILMEFLAEHCGEIGLALVVIFSNIFGSRKKMTAEEKKELILAKKEKKAAKQLEKCQSTMQEIEQLKKEE